MFYLLKRVKTPHAVFVTRTRCFCYKPESSKGARSIRRKSTGETKAERNRHNAYNRRRYLIYNNFDIGDMWVTLTRREDSLPEDPNEAHRELTKCLAAVQRKLKKKNIPFVWFAKTEAGERTRVHHHLFIKNNFDVVSVIYDVWKKYGKVKDFSEIYNFKNGKLVKYFLDGGDHKGLTFEKYSHSRNLKEPEVEKRIYPARSFREIPRLPKAEEGERYIIQNLYNFCPGLDGIVYQEYELIKIKEGESYDFKENDRLMQKEKKGDNS